MPAKPQIWDEIQLVMDDMAEWFYLNRISADVKKYKKWRIQNA